MPQVMSDDVTCHVTREAQRQLVGVQEWGVGPVTQVATAAAVVAAAGVAVGAAAADSVYSLLHCHVRHMM